MKPVSYYPQLIVAPRPHATHPPSHPPGTDLAPPRHRLRSPWFLRTSDLCGRFRASTGYEEPVRFRFLAEYQQHHSHAIHEARQKPCTNRKYPDEIRPIIARLPCTDVVLLDFVQCCMDLWDIAPDNPLSPSGILDGTRLRTKATPSGATLSPTRSGPCASIALHRPPTAQRRARAWPPAPSPPRRGWAAFLRAGC